MREPLAALGTFQIKPSDLLTVSKVLADVVRELDDVGVVVAGVVRELGGVEEHALPGAAGQLAEQRHEVEEACRTPEVHEKQFHFSVRLAVGT